MERKKKRVAESYNRCRKLLLSPLRCLFPKRSVVSFDELTLKEDINLKKDPKHGTEARDVEVAQMVNGIPCGVEESPLFPMDSWMGHIMAGRKGWDSKKLYEIAMPGTHNSATNVIQDSSLVALVAGFGARNQDYSPYKQMKEFGSRFLDFRVTDQGTSGELWLSHTFLAQRLEPVLKSIKQFLEETEKEIIIIQIKPDYNRKLSTKAADDLKSMVLDLFQGMLIFDATKSIGALAQANERLLVLSPLAELRLSELACVPLRTSWSKTHTDAKDVLINNLRLYLKSGADIGQVRTLDAYITPTARTFIQFKTWKCIEGETNVAVAKFMADKKDLLSSSANIVALDRIPMELSREVIDLNL